jgi:hypothetical protein
MTCVLQARTLPAGVRWKVPKCHEKAVKSTVMKQLTDFPSTLLESWTIIASFPFVRPEEMNNRRKCGTCYGSRHCCNIKYNNKDI